MEYRRDGASIFAALRRDKLERCCRVAALRSWLHYCSTPSSTNLKLIQNHKLVEDWLYF